MVIKYYRIIPNGYCKKGGILSASIEYKDLNGRWAYDGEPLIELEGVTFHLKAGIYPDYLESDIAGKFVSKELMETLKSYLKPEQNVSFVPFEIKSEEYGNRVYYLVHFDTIHDVIDWANSKFIGIGKTINDITVPALDYEKIKGLDVFNWSKYDDSIVVSERVKKEIKKKKLDLAIELSPLWCVNAK